jgi:hypothetical protein
MCWVGTDRPGHGLDIGCGLLDFACAWAWLGMAWAVFWASPGPGMDWVHEGMRWACASLCPG